MPITIELSQIPTVQALQAGSQSLVSYGASGVARMMSTTLFGGQSVLEWEGTENGHTYQPVVVLVNGQPTIDLKEVT